MTVARDLASITKYLREEELPHIWCPGCGNGIVVGTLLRAIRELEDENFLHQDKIAVVSGIGCSSRAVNFLNFNTLHTTHGRAIPFATGIKLANPEMTVIVLSGDGDATAIGGNHFLHACRRNIDINLVIFNNYNYGMTSGQYSPTTPHLALTKTSPYGNLEYPLKITEVAIAAGASFVARSTTYHVIHLKNIFKKMLKHRGFAITEVLTGCPTYFGRYNKGGSPTDLMEYYKKNAEMVEKYKGREFPKDKIPIGVLFEDPKKQEYTDMLKELSEIAKGRVKVL